ncbi:MAG: DMT family transporter [Pseudomonadota bacterium]
MLLLSLATLVFTAVTLVVIGDTAGKLLTAQGVDAAFVAWSRFVIATAVLLPFSGLSLRELRSVSDWRVTLRAVFIAAGIFCMISALRTEPIANVFGAFFIGPIVSYVLAVLVLGERVSRSRTLLLGLGFCGVLFVVKPGFGLSWGMIFALGAGTCYGCYLAMTRIVAAVYRPRFLLISQLAVGSIMLAPFGITAEWPVLELNLSFLIMVSALGSALGNYLLVIASRSGEASLIAPLAYTQLISATVIGIAVFADWPDMFTLFGLALICFSGLGSLWTQRRKR